MICAAVTCLGIFKPFIPGKWLRVEGRIGLDADA
jgi:hypothetical protein